MAPTQSVSLAVAAISIALVFSSALIGALTPVLLFGHSRGLENGRLFRYGNALAAGILAAAGFVHLFPEGERRLNGAYPDLPFPLSGVLALAGTISILCLDNMVRSGARPEQKERLTRHDSHDISSFMLQNCHADSLLGRSGESTSLLGDTTGSEGKGGRSTVMAVVLTGTLGFHGLMEGVTLGANVMEKKQFIAVMAAILAHKVFAAFSLGMSLAAMSACSGNRKMRLRALCAAVSFASVTPIGAVLGMVAVESWLSAEHTVVFSAGLNCASAGIFVYIAFVELLPDHVEGVREDGCKERGVGEGGYSSREAWIRVGFFTVAASAMSVLALWT